MRGLVRSVRGKLTAVSLALVAAVIIASGAVLETMLVNEHDQRLHQELNRHANVLQAVIDGGRDGDVVSDAARRHEAARLARAAGLRVTLIDAGGAVIADSHVDDDELSHLDLHSQRPEVRAALSGEPSVVKRSSQTTGEVQLYLARPISHGRVLRVSMPASSGDALVARVRLALGIAALIALSLAGLMSLLSAHWMTRSLRELVDKARALAEHRTNKQIRLDSDDELEHLAGSVNRLAGEVDSSHLALQAERDRFRAVVEGIADGVIAVDADGRISLMNSAARGLFSPAEAVDGKRLSDVFPEVDVDTLFDPNAVDADMQHELMLPGPPARKVILHGSRATLREGAVLTIEDVTDVRRLENVRRDFVANVSHELRTPVSVIRASAEALIDGGLDDKVRAARFADALHRNAERLSRLVSDLLDLARIESGRQVMTIRPVNVSELVDEIVLSLQTVIEARQHELQVDVDDDITVLADPSGLEQVLSNLVHNAAKYTPEVGRIVIRATRRGDRVIIEVEDNGPGIPAGQRDRVFERFYRVDAGRSRDMGGTGLGLSIVKHLTAIMGGDVSVEGAEPRGARFIVTLPSGDGAASAQPAMHEASARP